MPEYIPSWRRAVRRRVRQFPRPLFGGLSIVVFILLWLPPTVTVPLSNQLAQRSLVAWTLFSLLGVLILIKAVIMAKVERPVSMLFLLSVLAGMGYIAMSDPYSLNHLSAFIFLSLALVGWMFWMAHDLDCAHLRWCALGGVIAVGESLVSLGIGERVLVTAAIAFINILYYDHL